MRDAAFGNDQRIEFAIAPGAHRGIWTESSRRAAIDDHGLVPSLDNAHLGNAGRFRHGLNFASELHQSIIVFAVAHPNDREKISANRQDCEGDGGTTPGTNTSAALACRHHGDQEQA